MATLNPIDLIKPPSVQTLLPTADAKASLDELTPQELMAIVDEYNYQREREYLLAQASYQEDVLSSAGLPRGTIVSSAWPLYGTLHETPPASYFSTGFGDPSSVYVSTVGVQRFMNEQLLLSLGALDSF